MVVKSSPTTSSGANDAIVTTTAITTEGSWTAITTQPSYMSCGSATPFPPPSALSCCSIDEEPPSDAYYTALAGGIRLRL